MNRNGRERDGKGLTTGTTGPLTGALARELGEAVATIAGQAESLLQRLPEDDGLREKARAIRETAERAGLVVGRLLSPAAAGTGTKPLELQLNSVIRQMQMPLQRLVGHSIRLDLDLDSRADAEVLIVKADPAQIQRAILNLVLNARDAMPEGGRLVIETSTSFDGG